MVVTSMGSEGHACMSRFLVNASICDAIRQNESEVAQIQFLVFYLVV